MANSTEPGLLDYLKAAFFARKQVPGLGGVPLNALFLFGMGIGGLAFPGLWPLAAAIEVAYLTFRSHDARFRNLVRGQQLLRQQQTLDQRMNHLKSMLAPDSLARQRKLAAKCENIRATQPVLSGLPGNTVGEMQAGGLASLEMLYVRLLLSRQTLVAYLREASQSDMERRLNDTRARLAASSVEAMKRPLEATIDLLEKRLVQLASARDNLGVVDAELERLENQVDLIREEAAVSRDPSVLSARIDAVAKTIGETSQFLKVNEELFGELGHDGADPQGLAAAPPVTSRRTPATGEKEG